MRHSLLVLLLLLVGTSTLPAQSKSRNWSFWRGPEQNGISRERDLPEKFTLKKGDPNLVFAVDRGSITTPIVQNDRVYLMGKTGTGETQQESVLCFDADNGKLLWERKLNVWHSDIVDARIGFTHLVGDPETGYVYAHSTAGLFICYDKDGKAIWQKSLTEQYGRITGYGGRVTSAIIDEDKVILSMVNASWGELTVGQTRMVAFDKKKGHVVWWGSGNHRVFDTYYSDPVVAVIGGQRLILTGGGDGCIHAFQVRTGVKAWSYKFGGGAVNCSPVVKGDMIWIGHGEENNANSQGRIICLDASKMKDGAPTLVWKKDGIKVKFASPIIDGDDLYVVDDACKMYCLNARTGKQKWRFLYGKNTRGSPVLADGKIYVSEIDGKFHILKPGKTSCKRLFQMAFKSVEGIPTMLRGSPAVVNGRVYFTTTNQLICIGKKGHKTAPDKIPEQPREDAVKNGAEAAHLQVIPADVELNPGEKVEFTAITYDKLGRKLAEVKADWSRAGMLPPRFPIGLPTPPALPGTPPTVTGTLSSESGKATTYTAGKLPNGQFGRVVAKVGKLEGHARIRILPTLPYVQDFEKVPEARTPGGWVNTMAKFSVKKLPNGDKVLSKRNDNPSPLVAIANAYIGSPWLKDYTVESDVFGTKVRDKDMPDIGVGACRYTLMLHGNKQELHLGTWEKQVPVRLLKVIKFPWKPGTWYRMKIMATVVKGKGVIKGKVWAKADKEPEAWTLEAEDPIPNTEGAPLIYGFAAGAISPKDPGAAIYYDNVKVTPNKK